MKYENILIRNGVAHALVKHDKVVGCNNCSLIKFCTDGSGKLCDEISGVCYAYKFKELTARELVDALNEYKQKQK